MNKKGGIAETILDVLVIVLLIFFVYIIYKNFSLGCMLENLKSFSHWSMTNCVK